MDYLCLRNPDGLGTRLFILVNSGMILASKTDALFAMDCFTLNLRLIGAAFVALIAASATAATDFNRDIKPILAERCYSCHGAEKHKSGLRLDRKADAMQGGDS